MFWKEMIVELTQTGNYNQICKNGIFYPWPPTRLDSGGVVLSVYDYCPSDITSRAAGDFIRVPKWNLHLQQWFPKKAAHLLYPRNFAKRQTSQAPDCWIWISRNLLFEAPRWVELLTDMKLKGTKACILTLIHSWFQPVIGTLPGLDPGSVEIQMGTSEVLP